MGRRRWFWVPVLALAALAVATCSGGDGGAGGHDRPTLFIGGIPDQNVSHLQQQFGLLADYLSEETGLKVEYRQSVDYAAIVTAFRRGDVQLGWFGGLTGVQARLQSEGAEAIAQRGRDAEFHSVFIVRSGLEVDELADLQGLSFTFGSESSTSGHLMPRFFLREAGIDADADFDSPPNYSGSHDKTYKLVEAGAFDAGALNEAVWAAAVEAGRVDTSKVRVFFVTPPYFDYHFVVRGDLDEEYGAGATEAIRRALLRLSAKANEDKDAAELLELFQAERFVATANENYEDLRAVAEELDIIR